MPPLLIRAVASSHPLQVICAWPLSSQYGLGTRIIYYVLIAICLTARRMQWLVTSCLAAAFILPTVAALHGIVLTALHNPHAVDMDIFGAFQLCSIGILAAPVTVMMSRTYFSNPGRNTTFVGLFIQVVGLLSFVVEFCRIETSDCVRGNNSKPLPSSDLPNFPYVEGNNCGLTCSVQEGPFSPIRSGSANNIYVIPAPNILTFGTAILLAAACCLLAIVHFVFVWDKVIAADLRRSVAKPVAIKWLNQKIGYFLKILAAPIHLGAGLAILIVGEINFSSSQVKYQTEPMANVGQWAPVVGASLPLLVSLYLLLAKHVIEEEDSGENVHHCNCSHCDIDRTRDAIISTTELHEATDRPSRNLYRQKVKKLFFKVGKILGTPHQDYISERGSEAYPLGDILVPGEEFRNDRLTGSERERGRRSEEDSSSRVRGSSFANSFSTSNRPSLGRSRSPTMPQAAVLPFDTRLPARPASLDPQALTSHR